MKITKIGHCCLVIEEGVVKILTDPGLFSTGQDDVSGVDAVLITHEHGDHLHVESLKKVVSNNPKIRVITNSSVGKILEKANLVHDVVQGSDTTEVNGVIIGAHDGKHEEIYGDFGIVQNTGYFIGERLFYPGDSYTNPGKPVDILTVPAAGPWCRVKDAIDYAKGVSPKHAFPVHDGVLSRPGSAHSHIERELTAVGINFVSLLEGDSVEW